MIEKIKYLQEVIVQIPVRSLKELLREIERLASWNPPSAIEQQLEITITECRTNYPTEEEAIQAHIRRGQEARELLTPIYKTGTKYGAVSPQANQAILEIKQRRPDLIRRAEEQLKKGDIARKKWQESSQREKIGKPLSEVKPRPYQPQAPHPPATAPRRLILPANSNPNLHPQDIRGLQPSPRWTLLIDETGSIFDDSADELTQQDHQLGRIIGLLLPEQHGLASLPVGWHAVDKGIAEIDRVIQAILNAPVGVLGITVQQLPSAPTERWAFGVLQLIEWVLRLLPLNGPTKLAVQIEQRAEFSKGMEWLSVANVLLLRLAQTDPKRASHIRSCRIQVIAKEGSSFNGYADALAFIWGSPARHSRECLKRTGLEGSCFLAGDAAAISHAWEWLDRGITLEGADWTTLLAQPEADQSSSLVATLLERLGQASQNDAALWQRYLSYAFGSLDSKRIDLRALGRQVEWLERWSPPGHALPPPLRLLWLTAKLARANHLGRPEQPWIGEMRTLGDQLLEENAHLVCRAELNLAVNATNCYDFDLASRLLDRWRGLPKAVPGLRFWAQVQSSLGQHAAFRGDHAAAVALFDQALAAFAELSNIEEGQREARQTQTYRAIALMDDPNRTDAEVRAAVEIVTGLLPDAVTRLAVSVADVDKYAHHLLLRWLAYRPDATLRIAYLAQQAHWRAEEGHPWPLIQFYRAVLLQPDDLTAAWELALDGFRRATEREQGPLVTLIGACCRAGAAAWGKPWEDAETVLASVETALPLARKRVAVMRQFLAAPTEPLTLLRTVLPFNFH